MGAIFCLYLRRPSAPGGVWLAYQSPRVRNLLHPGLDNVSLADCLQCKGLTCKKRSLAFWGFCFHFVWSRFGLCDPTWKPFPVQPVFWCSHNSTAPKPPQPNKPMRLSSLLLILVRFSAKPRLHMGQWVFEVNILGYQRLPAHRNSISTSNFQQRLRNKILKNWMPKRTRLLFTYFIRSFKTHLLRLTLKESNISSKAHPCASGAARSGRCLPSRAASMISFKGPSNRLKDSRSKTKHLASASVWLNGRLIDAQRMMFYVCGCIFPIFRFGKHEYETWREYRFYIWLASWIGVRRCYEIVWICLKLPETPYWCRCRNARAILWAWPVNTPEWHHLTSPWRSQFCSHSPATPSLASAPTTGWCIAGWSQWDIRRTGIQRIHSPSISPKKWTVPALLLADRVATWDHPCLLQKSGTTAIWLCWLHFSKKAFGNSPMNLKEQKGLISYMSESSHIRNSHPKHRGIAWPFWTKKHPQKFQKSSL